MASFYISLLLFRIILPLLIGICVVIRPCGLSALYLLFLCYLPFVPIPTAVTLAGHTGYYMKLLIAISILTSIAQIAFQIVLLFLIPYGGFLVSCELIEKILRHVGFIRLDELDALDVTIWILPEVLMTLTSIGIYVVCKKLSEARGDSALEEGTRTPTTQHSSSQISVKSLNFVVSAGRYLVLIAMCFAAVLRPSVIGGLYFMIFLISATYWSCCKQLTKGFAIVCKCLMVIVFLHLSTLYAYQFQWPQEYLEANSTYARYFGLTPIVSVNCTGDPRVFHWAVEEWATYINPIALLFLYYVLAIESKFLLNPQSQKKQGPFSRLDGETLTRQLSTRLSGRRLRRTATHARSKWQDATRKVRVDSKVNKEGNVTENTPLIRGVSPQSKRYGSGKKSSAAGTSVLQDSTGSVTITGEHPDDIPLEQLGVAESEYEPTVFENILYGLETILHVIIKSSYIGTNIIMMAWSITYLSWITFVLLLWANLLWLVPNQRKSMLRSSPFLVIYAWFLLISAYIYSMNLTEEELPSTVQGINLAQVGFVKVTNLPCNPLMVKCLFTVMFWITLKQYVQELKSERQATALADMVSPLQVTVGTAAGLHEDVEAETGGSKLMVKLGEQLRKFLTKFWIWVVAITLFAVAITGERMTGFRILYMALFLFFVLSFQLSFNVWRKIMFGFWLTVIVYSMIILVMVYTYQFDNFQDYWQDYFHVPLQQQLDIGLEKFETKQLFVRLVTPTFFVIITVIQVHYFHKDFMELSDPRNAGVASNATTQLDMMDESSLQGGAGLAQQTAGSEKEESTFSSSYKYQPTDSNLTTGKKYEMYFKHAQHIMNIIYIFLELHMPKIVLTFLMFVCVFDKCAIYFVLIVLIVLACTLGRAMQMFAIYSSSVIVSIMLLARMIYQIEYIDPTNWNVTCERGNETVIENNAGWLGFNKTSSDVSLTHLVRWNICYILVVTLMSVVFVRQFNYRLSRGKPTTRAFFVFPRITRADADKDIIHCLKYLANYGFYKFGVEICFMATVALIGVRLDMYAMFYAMWLLALFTLQRSTLAKIWNFYLFFIAFFLLAQYVMTMGLPPTLCILFPWDKGYWNVDDYSKLDILDKLHYWAYLMDNPAPPTAAKLLCDFFLLLFVSRQSVVFRIENRYRGQEYPGGSNESIIKYAEDKNFVNPVPDFITHVCTYLDIAKRAFLQSNIWITLAIVFLAGTNRVNIFSIGYLCGAFIFLWQGSDLYLRPIPRILKLWNGLLAYNVSVIFIKTTLQFVGCIFLNYIPEYSCWLVQLLGIGCVDKFGNLATGLPVDEDSSCKVPREFVGLVWDGLCFGFLLIQKRIFQSYNFFHMINEIKATTILASRGAELIEELRLKRMNEQEELERRILEKIKAKMDKIKATQKKIQGADFQETDNHFIDTIFRRRRRRGWTPKTYKQAVRSGDYYMFDDLDDDDEETELNFIENMQKDLDHDYDEDEEKQDRGGKLTVGELLSTAMKTDIGSTLKYHSDVNLKRRLSMPLSRQKSLTARSQISVPFSAPPTIEEHPKTVAVVDGKDDDDDDDDEPQPGTSKDEEYSEIDAKPPTWKTKMLQYLLFIWAFIESSMISATNFLNRHSKDYRYVIRMLTKEKKLLKETTDFSVGTRIGGGQVWQPAASYHSLLRHSRMTPTINNGELNDDEKLPLSETVDDSDTKAQAASFPYSSEQERRKASVFTIPEIRILAPSLERGLDDDCTSSAAETYSAHHTQAEIDEYEATEMSQYDQPTVFRLLLAIWHIILSHSELLCYFVIFLNQIKTATFLSLPLPLMVFLWGTLTIPRPDKNFWVTIIAYTEVIVLIKCTFQFDIIPWNMNPSITNNPFYPPRIIGIERNKNYAVWDLLLLLVVFFHRFMLKSMGLWQSSVVPETPMHEGAYTISPTGELVPYDDPDKDKRHRATTFGGMKPMKDSQMRRSGDLQRLVEENDDPQEDENKTGNDNDDQSMSPALKSNIKDSQDEKILRVELEEIEPCDNFPLALKMATSKYADSFKTFFRQLRDPTSRVAADVYSYMFLCDFFNFFVILIGYSSFGAQQGDGGVSSYLEDNRVPVLFLLMLILQFMLIIIDRGIFLRKHILAKIIFQFVQVIILHIWLFIIFPKMTERNFNSVLPPQMYYMVKSFYLLLSAYQIRCGYPTRILGNFLCKGYNYINMFLFKAFMAIPFLFELRTVMDWMWTDTSMTVFDWIKMEDIFAHIFQLKCSRHVEDEYPQPRGERKNPVTKYAMGGAILAIIIAIIWFPLVFFSLGNAVGTPNLPYDITLKISIGPYEPVYTMSAQNNSIFQFTDANLAQLQNVYAQHKYAATFISNYEAADIAAVKLSSDSANIWSISPPDRKRMVEEVNSTKPLNIRLEYKVSHKTSKPEDTGVITESVEITVPAGAPNNPNVNRQYLLEMLSGNTNTKPMILKQILPKFLKISNRGTAKPITQLMFSDATDDQSTSLRTVSLSLNSAFVDIRKEWWRIQEDCKDMNYNSTLKKIPYVDCDSIILYTFNDKIFPSTLNLLTGGGIVGLYTTIVFVASRVLRGFFADQCFKIMFEDMPNIDRVLQLCLDIYLVREAREFALEEDLFAKLVFLFRSPETLIKWTRPKEEDVDDDDPEGNES